MNRNIKIGLALLVVASVFFLSSTVAFFISGEKEKQKRMQLEEELKKIEEAKSVLEGELDEVKVVNKDLESKLNSAREQAQKIAEELAREKEGRNILTAQLDEEKKRTDQLVADVMKEKEARLELVQQLSKAEESYRELKTKLDLMIDAKETLEARLKDLLAKKGVELESIEVGGGYQGRGSASTSVPAAEEGLGGASAGRKTNVLVVNKKFSFIVTNIGTSDGAEAGRELDVFRDGEMIARAKIEKIYDNMSAATLLPEWKDAAVKEGDLVSFSR